jgi:hypothetical protein
MQANCASRQMIKPHIIPGIVVADARSAKLNGCEQHFHMLVSLNIIKKRSQPENAIAKINQLGNY